MKKETIDFGNEKVATLFKKLFFPTLLGMLGMSAMTAIDGIFIGHSVGSDGIAAVNIVVPVQMLITGIGLMVGSGCSVLASVHLSQGQQKVARLHVTQAFLAVTVASALVIAAMLFRPEATALCLGSSTHLLPLATEYMLWYVPSWIFIAWEAVALFVIRLDGAPNVAMASTLTAAVLNIVLDWLFMFPLGWGLMGAAFATSLSTVAGCLVAIVYILFYSKQLRLTRLRFSAENFSLFVRDVSRQCRIGSAALLGEITLGILLLMGNLVFMHYVGDDGVGAFGIACYYTPFIFMVGNAIAQSAQPIISYNFGLGQAARVLAAERTALLTAAICGLTVTAAFVFLPGQMVDLFVGGESQAARIATEGFPLFAAGFTTFIFNLTAVGYYQSVERVVPATVFALMRGVLFLIPCFLLLPRWMGTPGIWLALPLAEWLTALSIVMFFLYGKLRKGKRHASC